MYTFSPLIERAVRTAMRLHDGDTRKTDPDVPYVTHLIHVGFILQGQGFREKVVAAGLLHDTLEDTEYTVEELTADFGEEIASMVTAVTEEKHWRWEERKKRYLAGIVHATPEIKAICAADKIHNLSSILATHALIGDDVWRKFARGKQRTLDFYYQALDAIATGWDHPIVEAYRAVVEEVQREMGE